MHEIDFLPVGDAGNSGDAICMRFTRPDTGAQAVVVIDAGYKDDGQALVAHIKQFYGTSQRRGGRNEPLTTQPIQRSITCVM